MPTLLSDLLAEGGFALQGGDKDYRAKSALLSALLGKGLALRGDDGDWLLTESGKQAVHVGQVVSNVRRLVKQRNIPLADMEVVELMFCLQDDAWKMRQCSGADSAQSQNTYMAAPQRSGFMRL